MQSRNRILAIANLALLIALIFWNYLSNTGIIDGKTVGSLSNKYDSLFTPAGYAFAIWGIIYLGLIIQAVHLTYLSFSNPGASQVVSQAVPGLLVANVANGLWLWFWLNEQLALSVVCMFIILASLTVTVVRLNMERWDAPVKFMAFIWWPIDIYFGWIAVATIANTSAFLNSIGFGASLPAEVWTVLMIGLATALGLFMIITRNMREFAAVVIWALIAIAVRHWGSIELIQWAAVAGVVVLSIACSLHAYKNRHTLPFMPRS